MAPQYDVPQNHKGLFFSYGVVREKKHIEDKMT